MNLKDFLKKRMELSGTAKSDEFCGTKLLQFYHQSVKYYVNYSFWEALPGALSTGSRGKAALDIVSVWFELYSEHPAGSGLYSCSLRTLRTSALCNNYHEDSAK
jgi:hypothetical protein